MTLKKKKLKENLEKSYETALLSKKLATIDRSVPLEYTIENLRVGEPDAEALAAVFRELEFRDLLEQFSRRKESEDKDYRLVLSEEELLGLAEKIRQRGLVALDMQTAGDRPTAPASAGSLPLLREDQCLLYSLHSSIRNPTGFQKGFQRTLGR